MINKLVTLALSALALAMPLEAEAESDIIIMHEELVALQFIVERPHLLTAQAERALVDALSQRTRRFLSQESNVVSATILGDGRVMYRGSGQFFTVNLSASGESERDSEVILKLLETPTARTIVSAQPRTGLLMGRSSQVAAFRSKLGMIREGMDTGAIDEGVANELLANVGKEIEVSDDSVRDALHDDAAPHVAEMSAHALELARQKDLEVGMVVSDFVNGGGRSSVYEISPSQLPSDAAVEWQGDGVIAGVSRSVAAVPALGGMFVLQCEGMRCQRSDGVIDPDRVERAIFVPTIDVNEAAGRMPGTESP